MNTEYILKDYRKKDFDRYNKELEKLNKEYQLFKTAGVVTNEYLEELFRTKRNELNLLISLLYNLKTI